MRLLQQNNPELALELNNSFDVYLNWTSNRVRISYNTYFAAIWWIFMEWIQVKCTNSLEIIIIQHKN